MTEKIQTVAEVRSMNEGKSYKVSATSLASENVSQHQSFRRVGWCDFFNCFKSDQPGTTQSGDSRMPPSKNNIVPGVILNSVQSKDEDLSDTQQPRETWDKKIEFLLAVVGFAVDLGNLWRFPYICYRNGGGAFLIPYLVMLIFGGLPLFYLELALGQFQRCGCLTVWNKICPIFKGIGFAICIIATYVASYYNTIIAWSVYYLYSSFTKELPWTNCNNKWNTENCRTVYNRSLETNKTYSSPSQEFFEREVLQIHIAKGVENIGSIRWPLVLCLCSVFLLVYFALWKGVKSSGKAVWITATMPYVMLFILLIRGVTLEGSGQGISYYLTPQWDKLKETQVWIDAATQIFFSLGPGFGTLLALASYNKFHNNCYRDALVTSSINCGTSFVAGFVIFSVLGHMAKIQNKDIQDVADEGPGLVFIVYPEAISQMSGSVFWSIIFFTMLITLGLDSTFGGLESVITGFCDECPTTIGKHRKLFVAGLMIWCICGALPTCTYGGNYVVQMFDEYGVSTPILFIVFLESVAVCWCYGVTRFSTDISKMLGYIPGLFWRVCWAFISPIFILIVFISALQKYKLLTYAGYIYPQWTLKVGYTMTASSLICVPIYMVYKILITSGSFKQRLFLLTRPQDDTTEKMRQEAETTTTHL